MITIRVDNNGKVTEVNAIAFLLIAYEEAAPRYGAISLMEGDFDDEMRDNPHIDFDEIVNDEGGEDE